MNRKFIALSLFSVIIFKFGMAQQPENKALGKVSYVLKQKLLSGLSPIDNSEYYQNTYSMYFGKNASINYMEMPTAMFKDSKFINSNKDTIILNAKNIGSDEQLKKVYLETEARKKSYPPIPVSSYKSYKSNIYYTVNNNQMLSLSVVKTDTLPTIQWQLEDSVKDVNGYEVNKATTYYKGRHYTAWYTKSIPVPAGPWQLNGLPGLILEVEDSSHEIYFELQSLDLNNNQKYDIIQPTATYKVVSQQEYNSIIQNKQKQIIKMSAAANNETGAQPKKLPVFNMQIASLEK